MTDGVVCGRRPIAWILIVSNTVVMLTEMIGNVKCWYCAPGKELLRHAWIVNLMYHYVEVMDLC